MAFDAGSIKSTLEVDRTPFQQGLAQARKEGQAFASTSYKASAGLDTTKALANAKALTAAADKLQGTRTLKVNVDIGKGRADLQTMYELVTRLDGRTANVGVNTDAVRAFSDLVDVRAAVSDLNGKRATVRVNADGVAETAAELTGANRAVEALDGKSANVNVRADTSSLSAASSQISSLMLAALALGPALIPIGGAALGALGAFGTGAAVALPALAATALGVSGVSEAVKALSDEQKAQTKTSAAAGASAAASAAAQRSAARSLASAERGLTNARASAAESAVRSQRAIDDAHQQASEGVQRALERQSDAQEQATETVERAVERQRDAEKARAAAVKDREKAVRDSVRADEDAALAAEGIVTASRDVARAHERENDSKTDLRRAEEDLTSAREDARRSIEDLQFSVLGGALAERRAQLQLREALRELQEAAGKGIGGDQLEELKISYEEAALRVKELGVQNARLRTEQEQTNRAGVEGSRQVVSAQDRIADAQDRVAAAAEQTANAQAGVAAATRRANDADEAAADARARVAEASDKIVEADRDVERASAAVTKARTDGEEKVRRAAADVAKARADGEERVREAVENQAMAQRQSQASIESALAAVETAHEQVKQAAEKSGGASTAAADKATEAMGKLSAEGQSFARFINSDLSPAFDRLRKTAQTGFLPGAQDGIEALLKQEQPINDFVDTYATAMGRLAKATGEGLGDPYWVDFFAWLRDQANPTIEQFGRIAGGTFRGITGLIRGFAPFWYDMGDGLESFTDRFAKFGAEVAAGKNQKFNEFLAWVRREGPHVMSALGDIGGGLLHVVTSLAPFGSLMLSAAAAGGRLLEALPPWAITAIVTALLGFMAVSKTLSVLDMVGTRFQRIRTFAVNAGDNIATAATKVRGAADTFALGARSLAGYDPASVAAGGAVQRFGDKAAAAGGPTGVGKLMAAGGGLVGFLGGPWGLALMAAGVGVGFLVDHLAESGRKSEEAKQRQNELREALIESRGAIDSNVSSLIESELKTRNLSNASGTLGEAADTLRLTMDNLGAAVTGTDAQFQGQIDQLNAVAAAHETSKGFVNEYGIVVGPTYDAIGQKARAMADELWISRDEFVKQQEEAVRYRASVNGVTVEQQRLNDTLQGTIDKQIAAQNQSLSYRQSKLDLRSAQADLNAAIAEYGPTSDQAEQAQIRLEQAQMRYIDQARLANGATDGSKQSLDQQRDALQHIIDTTNGPLSESVSSFIGNMGLTELAAMGATYKIDETGQVIATLPGGHKFELSAPNEQAVKDAKAADATIRDLKPGHTFTIKTHVEPPVPTSGGTPADTRSWWSKFWDSIFGGPGSVPVTPGLGTGLPGGGGYRPYSGGGIVEADGGLVIPGYEPGVDRVPIMASRGEAVLVPELVRQIGAGNILAANKRASGRNPAGLLGFAGGGIIASARAATAAAGPVRAAAGMVVNTAGSPVVDAEATDQATEAVAELTAATAELGAQQATTAPATATTTAAVDALALSAAGLTAAETALATGSGLLGGAQAALIGATGGLTGTTGVLGGAQAALTGNTGELTGATGVLTGTTGVLGGAQAALAGTTGELTGTTGVLGGAQAALTGNTGGLTGATGVLTTTVAGLTAAQGVAAPAIAAATAAIGGQLESTQRLTNAGVTPLANTLLGLFPTLQQAAALMGTTNVQALHDLQAEMPPTQAGFQRTAEVVADVASRNVSATQGWQQNTALYGGLIEGSLQQLEDKHRVTADGIAGSLQRARDAMLETSTWAFIQFNALKTNVSDPIKWIMQFPLGDPGLIGAWNHLDATFALNKHVNAYAPGFAVGGKVTGPGGPTADQVPAMLSNGEYVIRASVAQRVPHFLNALNAGQGEAMQAAGVGRTPPAALRLASGGPVTDAIARTAKVAASMNGTPYVWGGASRMGADCSGYQSIITNSLRGDANPFHRIGTTATMPWGGFASGLNGAYTIGNIDNASGGIGHMAGTLVVGEKGVNVESGSGHGPMFGGPSIGADNSLFNERYFLPQIGGRFMSGGAGGSGIDIGSMIAPEFEATRKLIADANVWFGHGLQVQIPQGVATAGVDGAQGFGINALSSMFSSGGGGGDVERWRGVVNQALTMMGLPLAEANRTLRRMNQESGGDPSAVNNWDINAINGTPSVGLMQVIGPTYRANRDPRHDVGPYVHGTSIDPLSNILASMHYTLGRYGSLGAGYDRAGGYDGGGPILPGDTLVQNRSGKVENLLNAEQSGALADRIRGGDGGNLAELADRIVDAILARPTVEQHIHPRAGQSEESIGIAAARYADRANRRTR